MNNFKLKENTEAQRHKGIEAETPHKKNENSYTIQLQIGGIPISIGSADSSFMQLIMEKYQPFTASCRYVPSDERGVNTPCRDRLIMQLNMNVRQFEEGNRKQALDEELWIDVTYRDDRFFIRRPDLEGEVNLNSRVAQVINRAAIYSFDSFLRILYSLILVQEGGFLLHAASVVKDGLGYIFMGKSGAGKSTIARHSTKYTVLSDEISLIRKVENRYLLYSTPFWGEQEIKGGNFYSPIQGIYQLKQSAGLDLRRLSKKESLCRLMENVLYFAREPFLTKRVFQSSLDFINEVSFYELKFQKNKDFWQAICPSSQTRNKQNKI